MKLATLTKVVAFATASLIATVSYANADRLMSQLSTGSIFRSTQDLVIVANSRTSAAFKGANVTCWLAVPESTEYDRVIRTGSALTVMRTHADTFYPKAYWESQTTSGTPVSIVCWKTKNYDGNEPITSDSLEALRNVLTLESIPTARPILWENGESDSGPAESAGQEI